MGMANVFKGKSHDLASVALRNRAPSLASAADSATHLRMVQLVTMTPFNLMGYPSLRREARENWPLAQLCAFGSVR